MAKQTPLYQAHVDMAARMVDFAGWDMPLHYGSQLDEHRQVRADAGMFDVSHMVIVDFEGHAAKDYLRHLLANDVARLQQGQALYSCMLNENAGIIDDLIVYQRGTRGYRVVVNAATRDKDLAWMRKQLPAHGVVLQEREDLAMIAVQGPHARACVHTVLGHEPAAQLAELKPFFATDIGELFIARTGYTGEDGYEMMVPAAQATGIWQALHAAGVAPIGLGARDTLRLEAGMSLYGTDMDESTHPLESALGWTVAWEPEERDFIGRTVLQSVRARSDGRKMVGLVLTGKGVLRGGQTVCLRQGEEVGVITSGSFSPVIGQGIALARVEARLLDEGTVLIRGRQQAVKLVRPPFVRHGQVCYR